MVRWAFLVMALCACGNQSVRKLPDVPVKITAPTISGPRRGPIILRWVLDDPDHKIKSVELQRGTQGGWVSATVSTKEVSTTSALLIWESFADVAVDGAQKLRLAAQEENTSVYGEMMLDVWNDPETERLIVTGHDLVDDGSGGSVEEGTQFSVMAWSGQTHSLSGEPVSMTAGKGVHAFRASPNGRAVVALEDKDSSFSVFFTPLDAHPDEVHLIAAQAPEGGVKDVQWSPDGRYLYAVVYAHDTVPASIWRWEPTEDLSSLGSGGIIGNLPGPPGAFAIDRSTGHLIVGCGAGVASGGTDKITLHDRDGVELARTEKETMTTRFIAIHPQGGLAYVIPIGAFSEGIHQLRFTDHSIDAEDLTLAIDTPFEAVFHPGATANSGPVLISDLEANRVVPIKPTASGADLGTPVPHLALAAEMDAIERGTQQGTVFVATLSAVVRVELATDGTATGDGAVYDFGMNTSDLLSGVAVQR